MISYSLEKLLGKITSPGKLCTCFFLSYFDSNDEPMNDISLECSEIKSFTSVKPDLWILIQSAMIIIQVILYEGVVGHTIALQGVIQEMEFLLE